MLRIAANRVVARAARRPTVSRKANTAAKFAPESGTNEGDGYGNDYGAGPSRLPYSAHLPGASATPATGLQQRLDAVPPGSYTGIKQFESALKRPIGAMTRQEVDLVIRTLLEQGRAAMATQVLVRVLQADDGADRVPDNCLDSLANALQAALPPFSSQPSSRLSRHVDSLIQLIQLLRSAQIQQPKDLLIAVMRYCLAERRPDKAAAIFVGMVEDWVTEGRVAEGADPAAFHPGGGPPVVQHRALPRHAAWWIGVRTWKLPGEVLSPHQRQDLWHPNNLSLGEKLRGFPFASATSPPSLVPAPTSRLLDPILNSLQIDPKVAAPADFEASMRALAILANSIHNRTLPCLSVGPLIDKLQRTPYSPPVYPLDMPDIPKDQRWAYEATVHIHLALQSLMFSPPISSSSFAEAHAHEAVITGSAPMGSLAHFYRMQPLGFRDCVSLVRYGFERLRLPSALKRLVNWTKTQYNLGGAQPSFWNAIFRGASEIKDNRLAMTAENALFGHTALAPPSSRGMSEVRRPTSSTDTRLTIPRTTAPPVPNQQSLIILIRHLAKTSQWDRFERLVYQLIPFLQAGQKNELVHLSPDLYSGILRGLQLAGKTGLAQRVYNLALQAERQWAADLTQASGGDRQLSAIPDTARLPIDVFTSMMNVWASEVAGSYPRSGRPSEYAVGWKLPRGLAPGVARHEAAGVMAGLVYQDARKRWRDALRDYNLNARRRRPNQPTNPTSDLASVIRPNADFFTATLSAHSWIWGLRQPGRYLSNDSRAAFEKVLEDMQIFDVEVPPLIRRRLTGETDLSPLRVRDWKCGQTRETSLINDKASQDALLSESRTRAAAEEMLQAEEQGLWRHQGVDELERRWAKSLDDLPEAEIARS